MDFPSNLLQKLVDRQENGSLRSMTSEHDLIDFASNDYLGFGRNEFLFEQSKLELKKHTPLNGSTGSRLLSGNFSFHEEAETYLASFFQAKAALLFNSGYDANLGLLASVPQRGDCIFYDENSHASIRDGIRLSHAKSYKFKHNDLEDLKKKIDHVGTGTQAYLVIESIYSMDGDEAPLSEIAEIAMQRDIRLIVDEAHSTGIYGSKGEGLVNKMNLNDLVFARVHTFGKAMGCHGAAVLGSDLLIQYLLNFARSFIYTTAMPIHSVIAIKNAIALLESTDERSKLKNRIKFFRQMIIENKLEDLFIQSESPIQSAIIPSNKKVKRMADELRRKGFDVKAILSPTVPSGSERIRFCIHSYNTSVDIQEILFLLSTFV